MEIIDQLVRKDEYIPSLMADLEEISSYDDIVEKTDDMEGCFLRVKAARQWWHGAAYGKLETNEEKKMYRERYGLKAGSINDWASATTKITENRDLSTLAQDPALNFSHAQAIAPLVKDHPEDAERLLQDAIDNELTATAIKREAEKIVPPKPKPPKLKPPKAGMSMVEAFKMVGIIAGTSCPVITKGSLSVLYKHYARLYHPDMGGNTEKMAKLAEAKSVIEKGGYTK